MSHGTTHLVLLSVFSLVLCTIPEYLQLFLQVFLLFLPVLCLFLVLSDLCVTLLCCYYVRFILILVVFMALYFMHTTYVNLCGDLVRSSVNYILSL